MPKKVEDCVSDFMQSAANKKKWPDEAERRKNAYAICNASVKAEETKHYLADLSGIQFTEGEDTLEVHLLPYGSYTHPIYGEIDIDDEVVGDMVKNFTAGVRGTELDIDYAHKTDQAKGEKAAGWIRRLTQKADGLWGLVKFTGEALTEIKDGAWKYMSVDYSDEWCNNATPPVCFPNVLFGAALTNRPFMKNLSPIVNFSEMFDVPPGKVEKEDAHYRMADDSMWRCLNCVFYRDGTCLVVEGDIDPDFTSDFFQPIRNEVLDKMFVEVKEDGTIVRHVKTEVPEEEVKRMHEFLQKLLEALGKTDVKVEEGKEEEAQEVALAAIGEFSTKLEEISTQLEEAKKAPPAPKGDPKAKKFAEEYPEQAAQLAEQAVKLKENDVDVILHEHRQIPPATQELLKPLMMRFKESTLEEMDAILGSIESQGLVPLGEDGSSRVEDQGDVEEQFLSEVNRVMKETEGMTFKEAATQVARSKPELAEEYRKSAKPETASA